MQTFQITIHRSPGLYCIVICMGNYQFLDFPQISKPVSLDGDRESLASSFPGDYYAGKDLTDVSDWSGEDS